MGWPGPFEAGEAELVDAIDVLDLAIAIVEREMANNPALVQVDTTSVKALLQSTSAVINAAASFSITDQKKLLALVQPRDTPASGDEAAAEADEVALGGASCGRLQDRSTSIVDVLEDLKDKAEGELADLRKAETTHCATTTCSSRVWMIRGGRREGPCGREEHRSRDS